MPSYRFIVLSNPVAGREDDFNDWYDQHHLREILAIPGIRSARRFYQSEPCGRLGADHPYRYLAVYEIETDDIAAVIAGLSDPSGRVRSDAVDLGRTAAWMFEEMGEEARRQVRESAR
jgi:hypothetical protein